jgi:gliding motility-associated-like protein
MSGYVGTHNISCFGLEDGAVEIQNLIGGGPKGDEGNGIEDYTYLWEVISGPAVLSDDSQPSISNIPAGEYRFTITDQIGCFVVDSALVTQPDSLWALTDTSDFNGYAISCFNGSNGMISITPSGGTRPYNYTWSEGGSATDTVVTNLSEGSYNVLITDPNACANTYVWTLEHPDTILLNPDPADLVECYGGTDTIHLNPSGGVGGFSYVWEGVAGDSILSDVPEGYYDVIVEDANNCVVTDSIYLPQRSRILLAISPTTYYNNTQISCYGESDGAFVLDISGGNDLSYDFQWIDRPGDDNQYSLTNIPAGVYPLQGVDASGCEFDTSFTISEPSQLQLLDPITVIDPSCSGFNDGSIQLIPSGGTPYLEGSAYLFTWTGYPGMNTRILEELKEGNYNVRLSDANNCILDTTIILNEPDPISYSYEVEMTECPDETTGSITINSVDGGTWPLTLYINDEEVFSNILEDLGVGEYVVFISDNSRSICTLEDTLFVEAEIASCLYPPTAFTPNGDGANDVWVLDEDEDGSNDMYLYPNAELTIFNRWGEIVYYTNDVAGKPWDGTYRGRDLPVDSYHWVLDLGNGDPPKTGNVTIIR